jgi:arylformamidase
MTEWVDLSRPLAPEMPATDVQPDPSFETAFDVETDGINVQYVCTPTHTGTTHVDAPLHLDPTGATVDALSVGRFVGEAVVIDLSLDRAREIDRAEIEAAAPDVRAGDIVMLSTGWEDRYGTDAYAPWPWLSPEAAEWLVEQDVEMLCVDTTSPDMARGNRPDEWWYPVHRTLLENGVLIAEHLRNLEEFRGKRVDVIGIPIAIEGGDAAPARFVADADSVR